MQIPAFHKQKHVAMCLECAILLEVSAPKPGNVTRTAGFEGTRYEHFLVSAVAVAPSFERAAERGVAVSRGELNPSDIGIGRIIRDCVTKATNWQRGGNTLLGSVIMLSPIAVAAGMTESMQEVFDIKAIRKNLRTVIESTTPEDAADVYEAIMAAKPGGLGKISELDVNDPDSKDKILKERISLYQVFKIASRYDSICSEWINNYPITFDIAYPSLTCQLAKEDDLNKAIVYAFLKVLAERPDTLIARKTSLEKAVEISAKAREILGLNCLESREGKSALDAFDLQLRSSGNLLSPGTTADIIAASLGLCVLGGFRP